jgi:hypothetical protein
MDDHHVEGGGLSGAGLHHLLELRPAVIGGRSAGLYIGLDQLISPRGAIGLALFPLIWDRHVVLGLQGCGDAKVKCGAKGAVIAIPL